MRVGHRTKRQAFSLLEMVIALAIGMVLLAALYHTLTTQVEYSQMGRDTIVEGALARSILTRVSNDIMSQVGAYDPRGMPDYTTTADPSVTTAPPVMAPFNIGIYGTASMLRLSSYRVQAAPPGILTGNVDPNAEIVSDLRRVTYWLAMLGSEPLGLAQKEFRQATNIDIDDDPLTFGDQNKCVIAKEVYSLTFEYFDGANWVSEWDGSTLGADELTPIGPPSAIRITIVLRRNANRGIGTPDPNNDQGPRYTHVIALPAVNFFNQ